MTTREKIIAIVEELKRTPPSEAAEAGDLVEMFQIMQGLGGPNPFDLMVPESDAEADIAIDKFICLLFQLRGDDLPPFDPDRYGEADLAELPTARDVELEIGGEALVDE